MPNCHICRQRIDLSKKGVRVIKCDRCGKITCRDHYESTSGVCYRCAGKPISTGSTPFSFIRKPEGK